MARPKKPAATAKAGPAESQSSTTPTGTSSEKQEPLKLPNLYDGNSIKAALDESAREVILGAGYEEDVTISNVKIALGVSAIACALYAQFGPGKFPANWWTVAFCVAAYALLTTIHNIYCWKVEGDSWFITKPRMGQTMGLRVTSVMHRYSDEYSLIIRTDSAAGSPGHREVKLTASVTKFFHEDGYMSTEAFHPEVMKLLEDYEAGGQHGTASKKTN